jgi:hypothetical protein
MGLMGQLQQIMVVQQITNVVEQIVMPKKKK